MNLLTPNALFHKNHKESLNKKSKFVNCTSFHIARTILSIYEIADAVHLWEE